MSPDNRKRTLRNIALLRKAEEDLPNDGVSAVREDLEEQLGGAVSRSLAAELLGFSHTALNRWVASGDMPVVLSPQGRREVPIPDLLSILERVEEERTSGRRRLHALEPAMTEARERARRMRPRLPAAEELESVDRHRISELRSLAYHRAIASQLRRPKIEEVERKLLRWEEDGKVDSRHADAWREVFKSPMTEIRKVIGTDDQRGRDLRQNSPLAGLLSEPERRKIIESVR